MEKVFNENYYLGTKKGSSTQIKVPKGDLHSNAISGSPEDLSVHNILII